MSENAKDSLKSSTKAGGQVKCRENGEWGS